MGQKSVSTGLKPTVHIQAVQGNLQVKGWDRPEVLLRFSADQQVGRPSRVSVEVGSTAGAGTAAALAEQARSDRQKAAEQAILADPFVQELIENFGAQVEPQSIRPREP